MSASSRETCLSERFDERCSFWYTSATETERVDVLGREDRTRSLGLSRGSFDLAVAPRSADTRLKKSGLALSVSVLVLLLALTLGLSGCHLRPLLYDVSVFPGSISTTPMGLTTQPILSIGYRATHRSPSTLRTPMESDSISVATGPGRPATTVCSGVGSSINLAGWRMSSDGSW